MKDFLIVADGDFLPATIILEAAQDKTIVSLDGATNKLSQLGITPDIILGDLDSIDAANREKYGVTHTFDTIDDDSQPYKGKLGVTIVPAKNQNATDLQKAIAYSDKQGAKSITIVCATGGRMDVHESNLRTLRSHHSDARPLYLITQQQTLRYVKDNSLTMHGTPGDKCGIVGYPEGTLSSDGLEYDSTNMPLQFGYSESTCNALRKSSASIHIEGEALVMMPPTLPSQREFMQKSEKERLAILATTAIN